MITCECLGHGSGVLPGQAPLLVVADHGDHVVVSQVTCIVTRFIDPNIMIILNCQVLFVVLVAVSSPQTAAPGIVTSTVHVVILHNTTPRTVTHSP